MASSEPSKKTTKPAQKNGTARKPKKTEAAKKHQIATTVSPVISEPLREDTINPEASLENTASGDAKKNGGGKFWIATTLLLAVMFGSFLLYEYQPTVRTIVQNNLPFLRSGPAQITLPLSIVYNANTDDRAKIQNFVTSLTDPKKGLQNTTLNVAWLDYQDPKARTFLIESGSKYLPIAFLDTTIEQHPQFTTLQGYLRKVEGHYYFKLDPLFHMELPPISGGHVRGADLAKADVTILEYGSFTCGYCRQVAEEVLPKILEEYSGKVALMYKHYDRTDIDRYLIQAAECAGEQNKFWEMHDELFKDATGLSQALQANQTDPTQALRGFLEGKATVLNLNNDKFLECHDSNKYFQMAQEQTNEGIEYGVDGTPGFFINGKFYPGAYPYQQFKTFIDQALAEKAKTVTPAGG